MKFRFIINSITSSKTPAELFIYWRKRWRQKCAQISSNWRQLQRRIDKKGDAEFGDVNQLQTTITDCRVFPSGCCDVSLNKKFWAHKNAGRCNWIILKWQRSCRECVKLNVHVFAPFSSTVAGTQGAGGPQKLGPVKGSLLLHVSIHRALLHRWLPAVLIVHCLDSVQFFSTQTDPLMVKICMQGLPLSLRENSAWQISQNLICFFILHKGTLWKILWKQNTTN